MSGFELIAILALVGYAIYKQTQVNEITGQGRFKLALIYAIVGVAIGVRVPHHAATYGLLAIGLAASLIIGLLRGRFTRMWRAADGRVYSRGTVLTVALFLGLVAFKFGLGTIAYLTHTPYESGIGEVLLMIGVMVGVQAEIIWRRAQAMGAGQDRPNAMVGSKTVGNKMVGPNQTVGNKVGGPNQTVGPNQPEYHY
jgi:hypothetical protein